MTSSGNWTKQNTCKARATSYLAFLRFDGTCRARLEGFNVNFCTFGADYCMFSVVPLMCEEHLLFVPDPPCLDGITVPEGSAVS